MTENEKPKGSEYGPLLQGTKTNAFAMTRTAGSGYKINNETGRGVIKQAAGLIVIIEQIAQLPGGLKTTTHRLFDALVMEFTAINGKNAKGEPQSEVFIKLSDYMQRCGLVNQKEARERIRRDLNALYNISLVWKDEKSSSFLSMRICDKIGLNNGVITFNFGRDIARYLCGSHLLQYPHELFKLNPQYNPNAYGLGRRLILHYNTNINKTNRNKISVINLLKACPELPKYEDISKSGQISQRIIEPFIRDLNALKNILSWRFVNRSGQTIDPAGIDYKTFIGLYVKFYPLNYPARQELSTIPQAKDTNGTEKGGIDDIKGGYR